MKPDATIVFTTYNRQAILRQAILAAQKQTATLEIIVMDDGSTDGTAQMMEREFPQVEYYRSRENKGPCFQRNRGIERARTKIVFPLDDDSILQSPHTIEQTLKEFDDRTGAVAIPFVNILRDRQIRTQAPDDRQIYLTYAYVAASHAVDREKFLKVGGYREPFFYMGEEGDLCVRLLHHKYWVKLGNADPIHHLQPPDRISPRADRLGRQNDILFVYYNTPLLFLISYLTGTTIRGFFYGIQVGRLANMLPGILAGYTLIIARPQMRSPVSSACFHLYRTLKKRQCVPLGDIQPYFESTDEISCITPSSR